MNSHKKIKYSKEEIITRLQNLFSKRDEVVFAYLFGSFAEDKTHKFSDIDVGVYFKKTLSLKQHLELINDICSALETDDVDVVVMNSASPLIVHDIFSYGKLLICRNEGFYKDLRIKTLREYDDLLHILNIQRKYLFEDAANG